MAAVHARFPLHVTTHSDIPPSPTLEDPDMILPFDKSGEPAPPPPSRPSSIAIQADLVSNSSYDGIAPSERPRSESDAEVGIATAVTLPTLVRRPVETTIAPTTPTVVSYHGYEHGAPLSDIGEEAEEIIARSRTPTPDRGKQLPPLRHKKRLSALSSSSGGSDKTEQWDRFDTTNLMSDRVAADIAQARDAANDNENVGSRRNSKEVEEELAILNERAEKILANAKKRLSSMEDNLTKARHSILLSPRSIPNMHELSHKPAGGLYRSISQNAQNRRSKGLFPSLKNMGLAHARTGSESVSTTTGLKRLSSVPEPRSASAMDFSPARYGVGFITEAKGSPSTKTTHSPASSRSFNSPLRILTEEGAIETPSTVKTSPDLSISTSSTFQPTKGLGIHSSATKGQEDLTQSFDSSESSSLHRSSSAASTRSARDLKDQMSEMKSRIADLRTKAAADTLRRRSMQNLRTPSPFLNSNVNGHGADGWYTGSGPQDSTTPTGQPSERSRLGHERKDSALDSVDDQPAPQDIEGHNPITPVATRFLAVQPTSARTDRNTPNLVNKNVDVYEDAQDDSGADGDFETSEDDDLQVAASEEEQIYLNEVLEESLHDPEVPAIPGEYLIGDELIDFEAEEAERHEDRLDAFDYENMFLHSAMGTYRGNDTDSDDDSLVTSREDVVTPTAGYEDDEQTVSGEEQSDEVPGAMIARSVGSPASTRSGLGWSPIQTRSPLKESNARLKTPLHPGPARTKSMETMSSVASFRTAIEGDDEDEDEDLHDEILNWGNAPTHHNTHANGVSAKAQTVLGWPAPPTMPGVRHSSYTRPQVNVNHARSASTGNARAGRSPTTHYSFPAPVQPPPNQPLPPPPAVTHQANTEILMESLIKLADPEFSIESTGRSNFADIDKELVLGLLRAVGGVCDGVLRAQHSRQGNTVKELRARLADAKDVLIGISEQEGLEEIAEDDEDTE